MTTLNNLDHVRYYAFTSEPWATDADGYAEAAALIDFELRPWYIRWDGDTPVARKGYTLVKTDSDEWYAVRSSDLYTVVWEDDRLQGGFGKNCPTGGVSATWGYDTVQEIAGERVLLQRGGW